MTRKDRILWMIAAGSLGLGMILIAASCHVRPTTPPDAVIVTQTDQTSQASPTPESFATTVSPTPQKQVVSVATRMAAKGIGILNETGGCLLLDDEVLAWPSEFEITRKDDVVRVVGGWGKGETWEFHIGEQIIIGGGHGTLQPEELEQFRISPNCIRRGYWIFGGGTPAFQITPQTP